MTARRLAAIAAGVLTGVLAGLGPMPAPASPVAPEPPVAGSELVLVPDTSTRAGRGRLLTYAVYVEARLPLDRPAVGEEIEAVLAHPRSWIASGKVSFQRVAQGARVRIIVASPARTDELCAPLNTAGRWSCRRGDRLVLNSDRWQRGVRHFNGDLQTYRRMLVNHEMGHRLGLGHRTCSGTGRLAPVMQQQSKGLAGCRPNPWPLRSELRSLR